MTIKWTPEGKVDRYLWGIASPTERRAQRDRVADALDVAVAALRSIRPRSSDGMKEIIDLTLRQIGAYEHARAALEDGDAD